MALSDLFEFRKKILATLPSKHMMDVWAAHNQIAKVNNAYDLMLKVGQGQVQFNKVADILMKTKVDLFRPSNMPDALLKLASLKPVPAYEFNKYHNAINLLIASNNLLRHESHENGDSNDLYEFEYEFLIEPGDSQEVKESEQKIISINQAQKIREIIIDIYKNNSNLLRIGSREFEELVAELLSHQGFKVELTKQTRDGGYDLIALHEIANQAPEKWLVECKRFTKTRVGVEIVRCFKEVVQSNYVNRGVIATTSYFSADAIKKREETPYLLDFRDKDAIMDWITDYATRKI